jgi:flagellar biosynthetic protein FlhB
MSETNDQEKTEEPTALKRSQAREKGQVALSQDVVAALSLAAAAGALAMGGAGLTRAAAALLQQSAADLGQLGQATLAVESWSGVLSASAGQLVVPTLLVVVPMLVIGVFAGYGQIGFQITPKALEWNPSKLNPASGWKKLLSQRSAVRTGHSLLKIALVGAAAAWAAWSSVPELGALAGAPLGAMLAGIGGVLGFVAACAIGTFVALAVIDALYQRWQHDQDLRMTREELRQEVKTTEGDPQVRARIREIQRRLARQRMMAAVPKATVVITNPTHVAVALRWNGDENALESGHRGGQPGSRAPVVVAKGVDRVAQRIKDVAREAGVPLREDVPLARALHAQCEIGEEIPASLYQAVAAVLSQVWDLAPNPKSEA